METVTQQPSKPILPDFTRWQWASTAERLWWSTLFKEASNAFLDIERLSVVEGLRKAAWQFLSISELPSNVQWAHQHGLVCVPVYATHQSNQYSSSGSSQGHINTIRVVFVRKEDYEDVLPFTQDDKIGEWLGYPSCCRDAFNNTWVKGQVDSTYEQSRTDTTYIEASTMLRWMGVRFVPHLPCTFGCEASAKLGLAFEALGKKHGYLEQMMVVREAQNWPAKWSRWHGIAEIEFPALKIVTRTDYTPALEQFTYNSKGTYVKPSADLWKDNGYSGPESMRGAHSQLIAILKDKLPLHTRLLDLGCGNGHLLRRLTIHRPDVKIAGIDKNAAAITRTPMLHGKWWSGDIQSLVWKDWNPQAVLVSPVRFTEMDAEDASNTRAILRTVPQVFLYNYHDNQKESLEKVANDAGFPKIQTLCKTPLVTVGLVVNS